MEEFTEVFSFEPEQRQDALNQLFDVAQEAEQLLEDVAGNREQELAAMTIAGMAYHAAPEYSDTAWYEVHWESTQNLWHHTAFEYLSTVMAETEGEAQPLTDYRSVVTRLFDIARYYDLPELERWSGLRVEAERMMVARLGEGDAFAQANLAEALFDHAWLTSDQTLGDEATAIYQALPEDRQRGVVSRKYEAYTAGQSPYPAPRELF